MFLKSIQDTKTSILKRVSKVREDARAIIDSWATLDLNSDSEINDITQPCEKMLVARIPAKGQNYEILRDMGISSNYQDITIDLRNNGNVMITCDENDEHNDAINAFVLAYINRFLESFPLGHVNVHIFAKQPDYVYRSFENCFQSGDAVRSTFQICKDLRDLTSFDTRFCEDVCKKLTPELNDLYSLYSTDNTDPFHLIVLRDGFLGDGGYSSSDILDTVRALSEQRNAGHKCGFRFLMIDKEANTSHMDERLSQKRKMIQDNCELNLHYSNGRFYLRDNSVDVLRITSPIDQFLQQRGEMLAAGINRREKSIVKVADVASGTGYTKMESIMYIPIGVSGTDTIELPLSCKDEDGTVAGQCIGYMAIGQSGSGKSSFFHSLVLNGCLKYSPNDLQFWLLDFKNGGASSKYTHSGVPHIHVVAENNKVDDALCLFQMILEEMKRRNQAFNHCNTDNIIEYNKIALERRMQYFPRIIIAIDEVQEIFRDDNASKLKDMISSISSKMRNAGIHLVMVAQNLGDGKSYMLRDSFLPSATGRICFRVTEEMLRESGYGEEFVQRKKEIAVLKTGEAYVSYGSGTLKKVRMAFASPDDMKKTYFSQISSRYPDYSNLKPHIIGSKQRLSILSKLQGINETYRDRMLKIVSKRDQYEAIIGEDVYRMAPAVVRFTSASPSSFLILGSDNQIASSLCTSIALSLQRQNVSIDLFNADRSKEQGDEASYSNPFTEYCQSVGNGSSVRTHTSIEFKEVVGKMYTEYLKRKELDQMAEGDEQSYEPLFLIVNHLMGIIDYAADELIGQGADNENPLAFLNSDSQIPTSPQDYTTDNRTNDRVYIQQAVEKLLKDGYRFNIYLILAIKDDSETWRALRSVTSIQNVVLFHQTEYADQINNAYTIREILKGIHVENEEQTLAVRISKNSISKIRPIIYKMSIAEEKQTLKQMIEGESL